MNDKERIDQLETVVAGLLQEVERLKGESAITIKISGQHTPPRDYSIRQESEVTLQRGSVLKITYDGRMTDTYRTNIDNNRGEG